MLTMRYTKPWDLETRMLGRKRNIIFATILINHIPANSYDMSFIFYMGGALALLIVVTFFGHPGLFLNLPFYWAFWVEQVNN